MSFNLNRTKDELDALERDLARGRITLEECSGKVESVLSGGTYQYISREIEKMAAECREGLSA